jgi:hypothetical protein
MGSMASWEEADAMFDLLLGTDAVEESADGWYVDLDAIEDEAFSALIPEAIAIAKAGRA